MKTVLSACNDSALMLCGKIENNRFIDRESRNEKNEKHSTKFKRKRFCTDQIVH